VKAPLFSDILYCQEQYRVAVENYLEPYMNYFVVEDLEEALAALQLLSDSVKGKAGFFVLSKVKAVDEDVQFIDDQLLPALTVIDVETKYLKLCQHRLKSVYFYRDSEAGLATQTLPKDGIVVLDRNGRFVKKAFSISGGSVGLFEGKRIGRAKNLANLQVEINKLLNNQKSVNDHLQQERKKIESLKAGSRKNLIQEIHLQINQLTNQLISVQTKKEQYQHFLAHNESQKEGIEQKIGKFAEELTVKNVELDSQKTELDLINEKISLAQKDYESSSDIYTEQSNLYNQQNISLHQQKNKVSGLEKDLEYKEIQLENIENRISQHQSELSKLESSLREVVDYVDLSDEDLKFMYE